MGNLIKQLFGVVSNSKVPFNPLPKAAPFEYDVAAKAPIRYMLRVLWDVKRLAAKQASKFVCVPRKLNHAIPAQISLFSAMFPIDPSVLVLVVPKQITHTRIVPSRGVSDGAR